MPLLGKAVRHEWALDWDFLSVNHGSFGAAPRVVLAAQRDWQARLEAECTKSQNKFFYSHEIRKGKAVHEKSGYAYQQEHSQKEVIVVRDIV